MAVLLVRQVRDDIPSCVSLGYGWDFARVEKWMPCVGVRKKGERRWTMRCW